MKRRFAILFTAALLPGFGVAACGGGVQEGVEKRAKEELEKGRQRVEERVQEERQKVEKQIEEGRQEVEKRVQEGRQKVEEGQ
jgi:hypothetical protein